MSDTPQQVHLNHDQAKAIVELTEGKYSVAIVREHRAWSSPAFLEVGVREAADGGLMVDRAYIVDRDGGYHRLPDRERKDR